MLQQHKVIGKFTLQFSRLTDANRVFNHSRALTYKIDEKKIYTVNQSQVFDEVTKSEN